MRTCLFSAIKCVTQLASQYQLVGVNVWRTFMHAHEIMYVCMRV